MNREPFSHFLSASTAVSNESGTSDNPVVEWSLDTFSLSGGKRQSLELIDDLYGGERPVTDKTVDTI